MSGAITQSEILELLFNKSFGVATTLPGGNIVSVAQDNAGEKIIPVSQIFTQEIPTTAPTDLIVDHLYSRPINPSGAEANVYNEEAGEDVRTALTSTRSYSHAYPWIVKYENFQLVKEQAEISYNGKTALDVNYLAQTIPFNYDLNQGYIIKVLVYEPGEGNNVFVEKARNDPTLSWNYENDAGFITFYGNRSTYLGTVDSLGNRINPLMTFWRYEGDFGLGTSSTGATGAAGATGEKGDVGLVGPTGPAGSGGGGGTYANDMWMLGNLFGQPRPVQFGTPVSTSTVIYIPWSYPQQMRSGWVIDQWLPSITNFTASITPGTGPIDKTYIPTDTSSKWIRDNMANITPPYVTLLAIQKTAPSQEFAAIEYTDANGAKQQAYAYQYYNQDLVAKLGNNTTVNKISARYSNPSTFTNDYNNVELLFNGFFDAGSPDVPQNVAVTGPDATRSVNITWSPPDRADITRAGEGTISSYDISHNTIGSIIRYGGPIGYTGHTGTTLQSSAISNLYPDASYSFAVLATNNSGMTGPYSAPVTRYSGYMPEQPLLSSISFNASDSYSNPLNNIYKVSTRSPIGQTPLINTTAITTALFEAPIHRFANRGVLEGSPGTTLMTLTAMLNGVTGPSRPYSGFPSFNLPAPVVSNNVTITPVRVMDYYCKQPAEQNGFYLKTCAKITVAAAGVSAGSAQNTLTATQTFSNGATGSSASTSFYYDAPVTTVPYGAINAISIPIDYFKPVCGVYILYGTPTIGIDASANNMGSYFYRSPLITYKYKNGDNTVISSDSSLNTVVSGIDIGGGRFTNGNVGFNSSIATTSADLTSTYSTSITIDASASNVYGTGQITSKTIKVITDGPSYVLAYSVQSIPTLQSNMQTAGFRIWSAPTVANHCPNLSYYGSFYLEFPYNNSKQIKNSDHDGELFISNGLFTTPAYSNGGYIDYSDYMWNSQIYYQIIGPVQVTYRFASFCWKLGESPRSYKKLSFTINSIYTPKTIGGLLLMNGYQVPIFYAFQDTSQPAVYNETTFNSGWINANSNDNPVYSGTFHLPEYKYGVLGGSLSPGVTIPDGTNNATINAFIPAINPVSNSVYLYVRIVVPMDVDIRFGSVSAMVSTGA
jgi:hypothetical protein